MTLDETETQLVIRAAVCTGEPVLLPDPSGMEDTIEGQVFRSGESSLSTPERRERGRTAATRVGETDQRPAADRRQGEAILCVPLLERSERSERLERTPDAGGARTLGVLTLRHTRAGINFSASDCRAARQAAGLVAGVLANAHAFADRKRSVVIMLQNMVISLESKDPYTMNHSHRVTEVCGLLAAQFGLDANTVQQLRTGAMLHDIGKIGVPAGVLNKSGNLTDEELVLLKQYPILGYNLCKPLDPGDEILILIRNHTEKLDGTGYPDGLRQGQIPLPLRILSVADAFDAMSSYRPYRKAMDARERNEQLNRFAGTQFDPTIVETLKSLLQNGCLDELYRDQWHSNAERPPQLQMITAEAA
jgi:HD-GYP domain-containing protein (c-di-GMP phosphodiesterase class II)